MFRSLLRASAALAFALLVTPTAPDAAPGPGLAYDEIVRILANATPPPPGSFQSDLASLGSTSAPPAATPAPKRGIGINVGAIAGAVFNGGNVGAAAGGIASNAAEQAATNALQGAVDRMLSGTFSGLAASIQSFFQPHLFHYAFWNGWERVDDATAQTATIRKCDMGQVIRLDLAKRTYTVIDPSADVATPAPAPARPTRGAPAAPSTPAPPGSVALDLSVATTNLGPKTLENQATDGYDTTATMAMTQATGSCRNGSASIKTVEYLAPVTRPAINSCPIPPRAVLPERPEQVVVTPPSGGCRPTITTHASGPSMPTGRLALYTLLTMSGSGGAAPAPAASGGGIGFLTERGNLRPLGATDAALFEVPAGFTKTSP